MAHLTTSVVIDAPVGEIFDYWKNPGNWPEVWLAMIDTPDVVLTPEGVGTTYRWVYKMAGMRFHGDGEFVDCVPNQRIASKDTGDMEGTFVWTFDPQPDGVHLAVEVDYTIPIPVLGKLVESLVLKMNEHDAQAALANLKARMEHRA